MQPTNEITRPSYNRANTTQEFVGTFESIVSKDKELVVPNVDGSCLERVQIPGRYLDEPAILLPSINWSSNAGCIERADEILNYDTSLLGGANMCLNESVDV